MTPLLFFYIVAVAQAAEITVMCRTISTKFENPAYSELFVFFEMEVFAFLGVIIGLFFYLTVKFILNSLYKNGPMYNFKTKGVKQASDLLQRNYDNAVLVSSLVYDISINTYLLSDFNAVRDKVSKSEISIVHQLRYLGMAQLVVILFLFFMAPRNPKIDADQKPAQEAQEEVAPVKAAPE